MRIIIMYAKFFDIGLFRPMQKGGKYDEQKSIMSEELKTEIAKELGVYDTVAREGWALLLQGTAVI